jgi:cyclophilin family peptidyl-prolyl cis-trans isomerase
MVFSERILAKSRRSVLPMSRALFEPCPRLWRSAAALALAASMMPAFPEDAGKQEAKSPPPVEAAPAPPASPVWISTEIRFPGYFSSLFSALPEGEPIQTRVLIHNVSKEKQPLPKGADLIHSLRVKSEGGTTLEPGDAPASWLKALPETLEPGQVVGGFIDLVEAFPGLKKPGVYVTQWQSGELTSNEVSVRVLQRFNADADYEVRLDTDEGEIVIAMNGKEAPIHTRNFVNLARLAYYDGLPFHTAARERSIRAGAPGPDGSGSIGYTLPAEPSSLRHVEGAVSMYRDQRTPGTDSNGSQFFVCLTDLPNRDGKYTVFGKVTKGLEVAKKISAREPVTDPSRPSGSLKNPAKIRRAIVEEKPRATAGRE